MENKTITAISTPLGAGGISIIRLSGKDSLQIAKKCFSCKEWENKIEPRKLTLGKFNAGNFTESCMAVYFKEPYSYTGEDVVEFQCHGGVLIAKGVLNTLLENGAVLAGPGEFTKRAFFNGKISLDEAEGVMDMINAESEAEIKAGYNLLQGKLHKIVLKQQNHITAMLAKIEVVLDYPENDYEESTLSEIEFKVKEIKQELNKLLDTSKTGMLIKNGTRIVIVGKPNVGKSSLMNAMLEYDRAIVTNIKGTTRDIIEETYLYKGVKFVLIDTAGVRESSDVVEKIGIEKAVDSINKADIILFVLDGSESLDNDDIELLSKVIDKKYIVVVNKTDLEQKLQLPNNIDKNNVMYISASSSKGIVDLKDRIYNMTINNTMLESKILITNERHIESIKEAIKYCDDVLYGIKNNNTLDLVSIDLSNVWYALGEITGDTNNEIIIDKIFKDFCVGK